MVTYVRPSDHPPHTRTHNDKNTKHLCADTNTQMHSSTTLNKFKDYKTKLMNNPLKATDSGAEFVVCGGHKKWEATLRLSLTF